MTDAPRYRLVGYDIGTAPDENGGWVHWTDHEAIVARLTAERDDAIRAKDCFQRMTRAHWEALCAMRNSINEYIPMPNTDSGPLFSPEDGPIYADIAERVIADLAESRAYALALEQELRARADPSRGVEMSEAAAFSAGYETANEAHQAALVAAVIAALHDIDDLVANSKGVSGLHLNGDMAPWSEIMDGGAYGAWLQSVERLREAIRALTPPADLAAKIGGAE